MPLPDLEPVPDLAFFQASQTATSMAFCTKERLRTLSEVEEAAPRDWVVTALMCLSVILCCTGAGDGRADVVCVVGLAAGSIDCRRKSLSTSSIACL